MDPGCADSSTAAGDGALLNAFASMRDEQAFAELVRRYSQLV